MAENKRVSVYMPPALHRRLRIAAVEKDTNVSTLAVEFLDEGLSGKWREICSQMAGRHEAISRDLCRYCGHYTDASTAPEATCPMLRRVVQGSEVACDLRDSSSRGIDMDGQGVCGDCGKADLKFPGHPVVRCRHYMVRVGKGRQACQLFGKEMQGGP